MLADALGPTRIGVAPLGAGTGRRGFGHGGLTGSRYSAGTG